MFGWIIYGIAGQCVPLGFGPSGAAAVGLRVRNRYPAFSLGGEKASAKRDLFRWSPRLAACSELVRLRTNLDPPRCAEGAAAWAW